MITFNITIQDDANTQTLPVSSFSYRSTAENFSGSIIVEGHDYSSEIADIVDNSGSLKLYKITDGTSIEIFEADIDQLSTFIGSRSKTFQILFADGVYTQSAVEDSVVDSYISTASLQSGFWSFRIPGVYSGYQHGVFVFYDSVQYYIGEIAINWTADGFGSTTLNESARDNVFEDDGGNSCQFDIELEDSVTTDFSTDCYVTNWRNPIPAAVNRYFYHDGRYSYPEYSCFLATYNLFLDAEYDVEISITSSLNAHSTEDFAAQYTGSSEVIFLPGSKGFECLIASGQYDHGEAIRDKSFSILGPSDSFIGTLSGGYYTIKLMLFSENYAEPVPSEYTLEVTEV